jgi:hypothetical protein
VQQHKVHWAARWDAQLEAARRGQALEHILRVQHPWCHRIHHVTALHRQAKPLYVWTMEASPVILQNPHRTGSQLAGARYEAHAPGGEGACVHGG